jgi:hypothetical protein
MKKIFPLLIACLLSFPVMAQRFGGGILAGFNACQVDGDTYAGYTKLGFALGAFTSSRFSDKFSGELQIKYMQKGAVKKITDADPSYYASKLNYIEIPVLLHYHQSPKISWHAGPGFGYLFSYTVEDENGPLSNQSIHFRNFELSGNLGMQYQLAKKLAISLTFSYSWISISDHPHDPVHFRQPGLYNNLFSTLLSYNLSTP